jgi:exopolysaccharide production protein ExoQ
VFFLLRLEHKQSPDMTRALWLPTILMLYTASRPLGVWFSSPGGNSDVGSPIDRAFLTVLIFVVLRILIRRKFDWFGMMKENAWLTVLIFFMLVSILWSEIPFASFKRWTRELLVFFSGFVIITEKEPRRAIQSVLRRSIYILIPFSWVLIKYFPQYGVQYGRWSGALMWIGVAQQKNSLGQLCALAALFLIWSLARRWRKMDMRGSRFQSQVDVFILILTLWLLKGPAGAYSATSIVMLVSGLVCYVGLFWMKKRQIILSKNILTAMMALIIVYGTATAFVGRLPVGDVSSSLGRDSTLTDRSTIWAALVPLAMRKPIIGYGFGGFWTSNNRDRLGFGGHNGYLEVLLILGFTGLILVSIFILSSCRRAQRELSQEYDWGTLWICCLLMTLLNNITESSLDSFSSLLMAVPLWLTISFKEKQSNILRENPGQGKATRS